MLPVKMCPRARRNSDSSDDSISSSPSSTASLSPPDLTHSPNTRLTYVNPISIPLKSCLSPPSTTTCDYFSISPATPPSAPFNSPNSNSVCAYPSWPSGDLLSSPSNPSTCCAATGSAKSSYISDEDLLDLEELELCGDVRIATAYAVADGISWSETRQPPVVVRAREVRISGRSKKKRRRSSPLKKDRWVGRMSPIVEE